MEATAKLSKITIFGQHSIFHPKYFEDGTLGSRETYVLVASCRPLYLVKILVGSHLSFSWKRRKSRKMDTVPPCFRWSHLNIWRMVKPLALKFLSVTYVAEFFLWYKNELNRIWHSQDKRKYVTMFDNLLGIGFRDLSFFPYSFTIFTLAVGKLGNYR